jgi:hypothetical protein
MSDTTQPKTSGDNIRGLEASFSTLILSIGSSAAMALGLAPNPVSGQVEKDKDLARFNIDLLRMLKDKTKGNLSPDEQKFLDSMVTDLQMKFVTA